MEVKQLIQDFEQIHFVDTAKDLSFHYSVALLIRNRQVFSAPPQQTSMQSLWILHRMPASKPLKLVKRQAESQIAVFLDSALRHPPNLAVVGSWGNQMVRRVL